MNLKNSIIQKASWVINSSIAVIAIWMAMLSANSSCMIFAHQPKAPDSLKQLRKF